MRVYEGLSMNWRYTLQELRGLKLPHFIVIGAQKAGTTSVHEWLLQYPGIYLPASKEAHYFTLFYDKSVQWYANHFAGAQRGQLRGDITPYYAFHPYAAERIATLLPAVRLIVLVRDPVERTISHYFHEVRRGKESLPLTEALAAEPMRLEGAADRLRQPGSQDLAHQCFSYVSRSRYELQIMHYRRFFASSQLLVLRSEDVFANHTGTWERLLTHIGASAHDLQRALPQANAGRGEAASVPNELRTELHDTFAPTYQWMDREYGIRWK
jgi:hypothetical protein